MGINRSFCVSCGRGMQGEDYLPLECSSCLDKKSADIDEKISCSVMYSENCDLAREANASYWESFIKNTDLGNLERWPMTMESRKLLIQLVWESAWDYALIAAQKIKKD